MAEQNSTNYQQNKVTTSGLTLFDESGVMLKLQYLDDSFSILIGEPQVASNGKRTYPPELRHSFIITVERAAVLYQDIILTKVLAALDNGEEYDGGVFLNKRKDAIFNIRVQQGDVYLIYYKDINENRIPASTHVFKCSKTELVEKYNPDGSHFEKSFAHSYMMLFCKYLEAGLYDLNHSSTHSFRKANYYTTNKIFSYLEGLAAKLGVTIENRSYHPSTNSGFMDVEDGPEELPFSTEVNTSTTLEGLLR